MKLNISIVEQHGMPFCFDCKKVMETAGNFYLCPKCGLKLNRDSWNHIFQKRG